MVGALCFILTALTPISTTVFYEHNVDKRTAVIQAAPTDWAMMNSLLVFAILITAIGLQGLAAATILSHERSRVVAAAGLGAVAGTVAALLWVLMLIRRIVLPPIQWGHISHGLDGLYMAGLLLGWLVVMALGVLLVSSRGQQDILGRSLILLGLISLLLLVVFQQARPLALYMCFALVGGALALDGWHLPHSAAALPSRLLRRRWATRSLFRA